MKRIAFLPVNVSCNRVERMRSRRGNRELQRSRERESGREKNRPVLGRHSLAARSDASSASTLKSVPTVRLAENVQQLW